MHCANSRAPHLNEPQHEGARSCQAAVKVQCGQQRLKSIRQQAARAPSALILKLCPARQITLRGP